MWSHDYNDDDDKSEFLNWKTVYLDEEFTIFIVCLHLWIMLKINIQSGDSLKRTLNNKSFTPFKTTSPQFSIFRCFWFLSYNCNMRNCIESNTDVKFVKLLLHICSILFYNQITTNIA